MDSMHTQRCQKEQREQGLTTSSSLSAQTLELHIQCKTESGQHHHSQNNVFQ